jgi:hypothetical protein
MDMGAVVASFPNIPSIVGRIFFNGLPFNQVLYRLKYASFHLSRSLLLNYFYFFRVPRRRRRVVTSNMTYLGGLS